MANLQAVVKELQQQNNTLSDVKQSIMSMLAEDVKRRKEEERRVGDDEEARRERAKEKRKAQSRPSSFRQGLAQGTGISTVTDLLKGFSGALGGGTLGGLLGMAAGKLFVPVLTGLLGANYLSKWVKPITDYIFGEGKVSEIFGQQIPVEKIGGAIAGVIGMLLAPTLIKKALKAVFGIGTATGRLILSRVIGKMGIGAAATAAGETVGELVKEAADKDKVKKDTKKSTRFKKFAQLFKVAGSGLVRLTIPGAIIGSAFAASYLMAEYIENRREQMLKDLEEDMDKRMAELPGLLAANKAADAAASVTKTLNQMNLTGQIPTEAELASARKELPGIEDPVIRNNLSTILTALETPKPPTLALDSVAATSYANVQAAAQVASLEETIMKRLPVSFSQLTRSQQEGIVGPLIQSLGLSTSGVSPAQLAADFVEEYRKNNLPKINAAPPGVGSTVSAGSAMNFKAAADANAELSAAAQNLTNAAVVQAEAASTLSSLSGTGGKPSGQSMLLQFNPTYDHNYKKIEYGIAGAGNPALGILGVK